ncbi:hypothetical protein IMZ48_38630 [Candidatus Bathyarchaeota archaeon]|nr:hypothetical protein [Candidatus Bathyarchaeota archaeon]
MFSPEACIAEIPLILKGESPANPSSTLGTGNVTDRPVAVALGGGHTDVFDETHEAVEKACGPAGSGLVWLKNDTTKPGPFELKAEYGKSVVTRMKDTLAGLKAEGKLGEGKTGVYMY